MDFDQLETFLEVARNLNFSRAAERLFRSQPAISAQIVPWKKRSEQNCWIAPVRRPSPQQEKFSSPT